MARAANSDDGDGGPPPDYTVLARPGNVDQGIRRSRGADRRKEQRELAVQHTKLARLARLGIHPASLAGRLRLVLTVGCYRDFRFTRDILSTGAAHDRVEEAIEAIIDLGANCDCQVFHALGEEPRGVIWHHPIPRGGR